MRIERIGPVWPTQDVARTRDFYEALGFHSVFDASQNEYLIVRRDIAEIHFIHQPEFDPSSSTQSAYIRPQDVDVLSEEWSRLDLPTKGFPRFVRAQDMPWGMRECSLVDLNGHLIRAGIEIPNWTSSGGEEV